MDRTEFQRRPISIFEERDYHFSNFEKISRDKKEKLEMETAKIGRHSDFIGVAIKSFSGVYLVLFVYGDDLTGEAIIGKCRLIQDGLASFKQFALKMGWRKLPVMARVFFIFDNSEKAFHFRKSVQDHCKHFGFIDTKWVLPYGVDMSAKSIWGYKGLPLENLKLAEIEAKLFS